MRKQLFQLLLQPSHFQHVIKTNMLRLFKVVFFMIPISLIHIIVFTFLVDAQSPIQENWRLGIIMAHSLLVALGAFFSIVIFLLDKYEQEKPILNLITQIMVLFSVFLIVTGIVGVDQLVTTSISPFIIVSLVISVVVLMPPLVSGLVFSILFIVFYVVMGVFIESPVILLTNRVNGLTSIVMALGLSNILWHYYVNNENQKNQINKQNKELENQKLELEILNLRLNSLASIDSVTLLLNRREFESQVNGLMSLYSEGEFTSSIMIVDLDLFKEINDSYGHLVGDELLQQFSVMLKSVLREKDLVARWGGDEFVVMIYQTSPSGAFKIAERLREKIENTTFIIHEHRIKMTASFGIAPLNSIESDPLYSSYLKADKALYRAKDKGRNNSEIYR